MPKSKLMITVFTFCMVLSMTFVPGIARQESSVSLAVRVTPEPTKSVLDEHDCYARFSTFAYGLPSNLQTGIGSHSPSLPWVQNEYLPGKRINGQWANNNFHLQTSRTLRGLVEIWIAGYFREVPLLLLNSNFDPSSLLKLSTIPGIFRLSPNDRLEIWEEVNYKPIITAEVELLSKYEAYHINRIVSLPNGEIWATYIFEGFTATSQKRILNYPTIYILAKFNDTTQRFETLPSSQIKSAEIPLRAYLEPENDINSVHSDSFFRTSNQFSEPTPDNLFFTPTKDNMLWVYMPKDGVYKFDPRTNRLTKELSASAIDALQGEDYYVNVYVAPSGLIYISKLVRSPVRSIFSYQTALHQYNPATKIIRSFAMPDASLDWPAFTTMLETRSGRLVGGAVMIQEPQDTWRFIIPSLEVLRRIHFRYTDHGGRGLPFPILESKDGRIWFNAGFTDGPPRLGGTAWYDPVAGEGCMFTTRSADVIEDSQGYVWTVVDDILYRREPDRMLP